MDSGLIAFIVTIGLLLIDWSIRIWAIIFVPRERRPQTAMAWILAIFFIPFLGLLLYFLFGRARLPKARRAKQHQIDQALRAVTEGFDLVPTKPPLQPWLKPIVELNHTLGALPLLSGNSAQMWADNVESFTAMAQEIGRAKESVNCEFFILSLDEVTRPFFDALAAAQARGVKVRVLMDHIGSFKYPGYKATKKFFDDAGIEWHLMLPVQPLKGQFRRPDLRNHRKLLVVDHEVGFTGSLNVIEPPYQLPANHKRGLAWKDYWVRFEGPVVAAINALFVTDWYTETDQLLPTTVTQAHLKKKGDLDCQVVPSGPGFPGENNLRLFNSLVYGSTKRIILVSPYFVPDDSMLYAITTAAQSGLHVELFVSEIGDQGLVYHAQRSYYDALLRSGVRIYLFPEPTILHAKHMTFDDEVAIIGSSNMDMRSFTLDLEISVMVRGKSFLTGLKAVEDAYRDVSRELTLDEWKTRTFGQRTLDDIARLTAALQ